MPPRFFLATLGCPKNEVDSAKLASRLRALGYEEVAAPNSADLVVVNTCAFIEAAREESIEAVLDLAEARRPGATLAVTGCLAERSGAELKQAIPEIDVVAGFGMDVVPPASDVPVRLRARSDIPAFDLLELPRAATGAPWAYVKIAEGCDRRCGFCAIPSFRGRQRSRSLSSVLSEVDALSVSEIILVAQDLASYGNDRQDRSPLDSGRDGPGIVELVKAVSAHVPRVRLLYVYPSSLSDALIETISETSVPYYDLSLQHVSKRLLRAMRRPGSTESFLALIGRIRKVAPSAALRSSFILGYPGETEEDHDQLLRFLEEVELDWAGFFTFSPERGTLAETLPGQVDHSLALERLRECAELQDRITARRRSSLLGSSIEVLVDEPGVARSYREAPQIDGIVRVPEWVSVGSITDVRVSDSAGPDLFATPIDGAAPLVGAAWRRYER